MKFFKWFAGWMHRFLAVDNSVNEHTVMGLLAFIPTIVFGCLSLYPAMGAFLGYSAVCFGLNWKYKE
jgi:hypothetical protein